jgi:hypothetical protein
MKKMILTLLFPLQTFALSFEVVGPCAETPIYQTTTTLHHTSLGYLTEYLFKKDNVPYTGTESGITSIFNSAVGNEALEVLSNNTMRAYGWCVEVDGRQPGQMPDKVRINENTKHIRWFYAFTLYDAGDWSQFCTPSYLIKSKQMCE